MLHKRGVASSSLAFGTGKKGSKRAAKAAPAGRRAGWQLPALTGSAWAYCRPIAASLLAWALAGCGYVPECGSDVEAGQSLDGTMCAERLAGELRIDSAFTPAQIEAVMQAGEDWRTATGGRVRLTYSVGAPCNVCVARRPLDFPGVAAQSKQSTGMIHVLPWVEPATMRPLVAHELGHGFGLGHASAPDRNMHPDAAAPIGAADVARFDALWRAHF